MFISISMYYITSPRRSACKVLLLLFSFSIQVSRILYSFSTAFRRSSRPVDTRDTALSSLPDGDLYTFTVSLEVKEDDGKGNYRCCTQTRGYTLWLSAILL